MSARTRIKPRGQNNPNGLTPDQLCLVEECGPWIEADRADFHHISPRMQQWLIRLDDREIADLEFAIAMAVRVRSLWKWTRRCIYGFGVAFGGVYAFGEKLGKLPETTQSAISGALRTIEMLRKLLAP